MVHPSPFNRPINGCGNAPSSATPVNQHFALVTKNRKHFPQIKSDFQIISGGQTGVDRAALDVARELEIPCGGWIPKGRRAENGAIPEWYPLREMPSSRYSASDR